VNKPMVTNPYFRAGTSHKGNRLYDVQGSSVFYTYFVWYCGWYRKSPFPVYHHGLQACTVWTSRLMSYAQISMTPLTIKRRMWFLHEGVLPHFSSAAAHYLRW